MRVEGSPRSSAICTPASTFGCVKSGHCNASWDLLESYYIKVTSVQSGSPTGFKVWNAAQEAVNSADGRSNNGNGSSNSSSNSNSKSNSSSNSNSNSNSSSSNNLAVTN
ncbi:hypothetical protein HZH66_008946 [Vespula vulgaris]|uniref:Uncharacterized protein n=1 Tax=Vespula vulgaris TaxID=7454 RepID=A0A834JQV3_VESVU|nr:hypothetical protein HZH66_008946 [Vespula vulgaris]